MLVPRALSVVCNQASAAPAQSDRSQRREPVRCPGWIPDQLDLCVRDAGKTRDGSPARPE